MLTPEEIQSREFLVSLRGYDRDEVHAFLDEVAEAFAQLRAQAGVAPAPDTTDVDADAPEATPEPAAAAPTPPAAEPPSTQFAVIAAETQRILEAAQTAGEEIRKRAETEAETARAEAMAEAEGQVRTLREQASATNEQITQLLQRRGELADRLRQARETVDLALLEVEDEVQPEPVDATTSVLAESDEPASEDQTAPAESQDPQGDLLDDLDADEIDDVDAGQSGTATPKGGKSGGGSR